jgi:hypothetical protein
VLVGITVKRNDYNRDGVSDIVAVNFENDCLYRWYGNGSGGFGAGAQVSCNWGPYYGSLTAVGDLNRDGTGDLVAINVNDDCLYRWTGNGNGGFNAGTRLGCGWAPYFFGITGPGDINSDGVGDLVSINTDNQCLYRWYGNGNGGFGAGTQVGCNWGPYELALTGAGDLNRDNDADLVAGNANDECLYRWNGNGNGSFGSGARFGCNWGPHMYKLAGMGDLNRDGNGDLVAINSDTDCLYRWSGNGSNGFGAGTQIGCGWGNYTRIN